MDLHAPLSTNPDDFCFIDTETRSFIDVTVGGAYRHNERGRVLMVPYAIGKGECKVWVNNRWTEGTHARLHWADAPQDLKDFLRRVAAGEAWLVAWNSAFDRLALNKGIDGGALGGSKIIKVPHFLDAMVQGTRCHLPADLAGAAERIGGVQKDKDAGKVGINLFSAEGKPHTPETHPKQWEDFIDYSADDVEAMRDIWFATAPLSRGEWREFWASEYINDRGLPMDVPFMQAAAEVAKLEKVRADAALAELTGNVVTTVHQSARMLKWMERQIDASDLQPELWNIFTREVIPAEDRGGDDDDPEGSDVKYEAVMSLERTRVESAINAMLRQDEEEGLTDAEADVLDLLELRLWGASATPQKFGKALPLLSATGQLQGQYVFGGAPATGRFSSRGLQVHNLTRATVGDRQAEIDAINLIMDLPPAAARDALQKRFGPVGRTLSRLIRPAICAPEGKRLIWADYSAIEARVLPWLAGPDGEVMLDVFRKNDADPSLPDIYRVQAGEILDIAPTTVTKAQRQSHGKVPVLSLGFGGGEGALFAMGRNYGVHFRDDEASGIVRAWRQKNRWAVTFWEVIWDAVNACLDAPGQLIPAGRVHYIFEPGFMGGTLICLLPDGRPLFYPSIKYRWVKQKDKKTGQEKQVLRLAYRNGRGIKPLWYGVFAENITQAVAASLLRLSIVRLMDTHPQLVVGHTHDEVIALTSTEDVAAGREALERAMLDLPAWAEGLPITAEATDDDYYTKTGD